MISLMAVLPVAVGARRWGCCAVRLFVAFSASENVRMSGEAGALQRATAVRCEKKTVEGRDVEHVCFFGISYLC